MKSEMKLITNLILLPLSSSFMATTLPLRPVVRSGHFAKSGDAPQYEKIDAKLREAENLAKGSVMLHIDSSSPVDFKAGHVIALEMEKVDGHSEHEDTIKNGGWSRGPYTISRATDDTFDVLIKVVGDKSKAFAAAEPGTHFRFGGKFKVPITEGIDKESTKRVVLISTGVGIGPCVGAIEEAMNDDTFPPIELYPSFRTAEEVTYGEHLNHLVDENSQRLKWNPIITGKIGRLSSSETNLKSIEPSNDLSLLDTHYHLIGNGQMVQEWKEGLSKAGVPDGKVTTESYFNHKERADDKAISNIAKFIRESCVVVV
jgi:ferredoxin-NADP reductase